MPDFSNQAFLADTTVYINAGGRGSRLDGVLPSDPELGIAKAMIRVAGSPLVDYHVARYLALGVSNVIVGAGDHLSVADHIDRMNGANDRVVPTTTDRQYGTGGDLLIAYRTMSDMFRGTVLVCNVDTLLETDETEVVKQHNDRSVDATIVLTTRSGVPNEGSYLVDSSGLVLHSQETHLDDVPDLGPDVSALSSCGMVALSRELLEVANWTAEDGQLSLYRQLLRGPIDDGTCLGFNNGKKFFTDIGTPFTYAKIQRNPDILHELSSGLAPTRAA